jgi:acetylornithine deacetylase/succinyl-diaminopimelate desuccinylase family protein
VADFAAHLDRERLVGRLSELVQTASENPPGNEFEVARLVEGYCRSLGLDVSTHEAELDRPSVVARWKGDSGPTLGYCSHYDVVPAGDVRLWDVDPFGASISDGRMYGRGSADAKGPIAAALEAVEILRRAGVDLRGTLELELVADEETMGFKGAGFLVAQGIVAPDIAIVGEPTSLRVVRAQRGACWIRITTNGVAAHGSAPERGISAVRHMAELVLRLEETLPDITHPVLGGPTVSVGTIRGGEKVNIIPASCTIEVDRRTVPGESEESVLATIHDAVEVARKRFPDMDAQIELLFQSNPFEVDEDSPMVRTVARSISDVTERDTELVGFRGASDARFLFEAGAEVILCGPGDITLAHTAREWIDLDELEHAALGYALSFARLLGPPEDS